VTRGKIFGVQFSRGNFRSLFAIYEDINSKNTRQEAHPILESRFRPRQLQLQLHNLATMADKYILRVTAGSTYDLEQHVEVPVNTGIPVQIDNEHMDIELNVRVQNYKGLPRGSPSTSPYFNHEPHAYNKDQYSLAFRFTPKRPSANTSSNESSSTEGDGEEEDNSGEDDDSQEEELEGISAMDLQFGNDFDHPIRDRLPPGFGTAMNIVKWWIDPGLEGDAYADMPYLYGPALSSFNAVHAGPGILDESKGGLWFEEGGDDVGLEWRRTHGAPDDAKARMKWALKPDSKQRWVWEYGRTYGVDFYNPYVDFGDFALRLPGFHLPIMKYWDGQGLRYVLLITSPLHHLVPPEPGFVRTGRDNNKTQSWQSRPAHI
jgi:Protein of unknown function (DUF1769)